MKFKAAAITLSMILIAACGSESSQEMDEIPVEITANSENSRIHGIWDITGDWENTPADEAYLYIYENPDVAGESVIIFFDYDGDAAGEGMNCYLVTDIGTSQFDPNTGIYSIIGVLPFAEPAFISEDGNTLVMQIEGRDSPYEGYKVTGIAPETFNQSCF